jgi:hypothetical protein
MVIETFEGTMGSGMSMYSVTLAYLEYNSKRQGVFGSTDIKLKVQWPLLTDEEILSGRY